MRYRAAVSLPGFVSVLPEDWGRELCAGIGWTAHRLVGRDRRLARANLARVHPEWAPSRVRAEARRVFLELGRNVYDFLRFADLPGPERERLVELRGEEVLDAVRHRGRGAVLVTGHLGCWELLAATLAARRYPLLALARPLRERRLEVALSAHRERMGIRTLSSEALPLGALRHLRRGGFLGVLADQRVKQGGHLVRFLGQETRMAEGPVRLAQAARAPLVPLGIHRGADHRHTIRILSPIESAGNARDRTQQVADALGRLIREAPEQWVWIHPRWEEAPVPARTERPVPARGALAQKGGPACAAR